MNSASRFGSSTTLCPQVDPRHALRAKRTASSDERVDVGIATEPCRAPILLSHPASASGLCRPPTNRRRIGRTASF